MPIIDSSSIHTYPPISVQVNFFYLTEIYIYRFAFHVHNHTLRLSCKLTFKHTKHPSELAIPWVSNAQDASFQNSPKPSIHKIKHKSVKTVKSLIS